MRVIIFAWQWAAALAAKIRLPISVWLLPDFDVLLTCTPFKLLIFHNHNRHTHAAGEFAANAAMANINILRRCGYFKLRRATIACTF